MVAALLLLAAGWAALSSPSRASACYIAQPDPMAVLELSGVAVVAQVESVTELELRLLPQAYLKGPANSEPIVFTREKSGSTCDAAFEAGQRVLLFIPGDRSGWPMLNQVFPLIDGYATWADGRIGTESDVISEIRTFTGQYAVPATGDEQGATLDWQKVVLPVGLATLGIFAVSLVFMRMWHKIDPS